VAATWKMGSFFYFSMFLMLNITANATFSSFRLRNKGFTSPSLRRFRSHMTSVRATELLENEAMNGLEIERVSDGESKKVKDLLSGKKRVVAAFFTQWGDFDSFEMAQRMIPYIEKLKEKDVDVFAVGIGTMDGAKEFSELTGFPSSMLYVDSDADSYKTLGFAPGFGRRGIDQPSKWWNSDPVLSTTEEWSPYAKLLLMCAGIGSPGTLQEVFRGYLGDRDAPEISKRFPKVLPEAMTNLFGVLGEGYQRPFELATVRLVNMGNILTRWDKLTPEDKQLILQRGGALVVEDGKVLYSHKDEGILGYADVDKLMEIALDSQQKADAVSSSM